MVVVREDGAIPEIFRIVGSFEANPVKGSSSNESPLGRCLFNHRIVNELAVESPDGQLRF